jgi:hypothetical protein
MVPLTIIGLFILGLCNLKFRELAFTLIFLLLFNGRFRRLLFKISKLFIFGLRKKSNRKNAFRNSKRLLKVIGIT